MTHEGRDGLFHIPHKEHSFLFGREMWWGSICFSWSVDPTEIPPESLSQKPPTCFKCILVYASDVP